MTFSEIKNCLAKNVASICKIRLPPTEQAEISSPKGHHAINVCASRVGNQVLIAGLMRNANKRRAGEWPLMKAAT